MFVKKQLHSGHAYFFLCIAEHGGNNGNNEKVVEYSVCLGETLSLSSTRWLDLLRASNVFRSVPLDDVLEVVEKYVEKYGLDSNTVVGLRQAVREAGRQTPGRSKNDGRRAATNDYEAALELLGVPLGSSNNDIESAFRKCARLHHPDVGGNPAKFRAVVEARNLLLSRSIVVE